MLKQDFTWPPCYTLRKHPRARHVKLKASIKNGLEITVPMRFNQKHLPQILEENKSWIEEKLTYIRHRCNEINAGDLPTEIILQAINQKWKISYIKTNIDKIKLFSRPEQEIVLMGKVEDKILCKKILIRWLKKQAQKYLAYYLQKISEETKLSYKDVTIRSQQTRWGSCSSDKSINLNYKLILLPVELMRHILIHELCHTIHLNHSAHFWRLVASFDPLWKELNREIKQGDKHIPSWLI